MIAVAIGGLGAFILGLCIPDDDAGSDIMILGALIMATAIVCMAVEWLA